MSHHLLFQIHPGVALNDKIEVVWMMQRAAVLIWQTIPTPKFLTMAPAYAIVACNFIPSYRQTQPTHSSREQCMKHVFIVRELAAAI